MNGHENEIFEQIIEGNTKLIVPKKRIQKGPASKKMPVFYNEAMRFARDVTVLVVKRMCELWRPKFGHFEILDGLAGTGARGVRIANEVSKMGFEDKVHVTINDVSPKSIEIIKKNLDLNSLKNAEISTKSLNVLLSEKKFDFIDIDPFGSPAPFVDSAMRAIPRLGIVAVTATDTAALSGAYPLTCARRYGGYSKKTVYMHETGTRILVGFLVREGLKYDLAPKPILVHATDHYIRAYVQFKRDVDKANESLSNLGYAVENSDGKRFLTRWPSSDCKIQSGPLWLGSLFDKEYVDYLDVSAKLSEIDKVKKYVSLWREEADAPGLFYDLDEISSRLKISPPKLEKVIKGLTENGFIATRTSFSPKGFKTNAEIKDIIELFRSLSSGEK